HTLAARTHDSGSMAPPSAPLSATDRWQKTSVPVCYPHKPTGGVAAVQYLNFSNRRGEKAKRKAGPRFATKDEAIPGMLAFRTSWEYSHRGKLSTPTEADPVPTPRLA
ncbi:unnamed protein product, partial [Pylaiella littoralis]